MKGYFRKRGNTWSFTVDIGTDPVTGKRIQKTKSGFKTKKKAQEACNELINTFNKGHYVHSADQLIKDYIYEWLEMYCKPKLKDTTVRNYKRAIDYRIIPYLGNLKLSELKPTHGQQYVKKLLNEDLSPGYIEYCFTILYGSIEHAIKLELLYKNPLQHVEVPRSRRKINKTWSMDEINRFLRYAKFDNPIYYYVFLIALHTGMRRGEFLGLKWENFDLKTGIINVVESLVYDEDGFRFSSLKNTSSYRQIPVDETVSKEMRQYKKMQNEFKLHAGIAYEDKGLVFCREDGKPIYPRTLATIFDRVIKKADVTKIRIHDMRHTHATILLKLKENPKVVSERLGHSSIKTTMDTYSHVLPDMQKETSKNFSEALKNNKSS